MNKPHKTIALCSVILLAITLTVGGIYLVSADPGEEDTTNEIQVMPRWGFRGPLFGSIDEELRVELYKTIQEMKDEESSFEEIRNYIQSFLEKNDIEQKLPDRPELSEAQIEAFKQLHEDVQEYAQKRADELGFELPENGFFGGFRRSHGSMHGRCHRVDPEG